jgi:hypothetical protein
MIRRTAIGLALMAIVAMLFSGIAGATLSVRSLQSSDAQNGLAFSSVNVVDKERVTLTNHGTNAVNLDGFVIATDNGVTFRLPSISINPGTQVNVNFQNPGGMRRDLLNDDFGAVSLFDAAGSKLATLQYNSIPTSLTAQSDENRIQTIDVLALDPNADSTNQLTAFRDDSYNSRASDEDKIVELNLASLSDDSPSSQRTPRVQDRT